MASSRSTLRAPTAPPGWDYNPSSWGQRPPIVLLAVVGFAIAGYLSLFQLEIVDSVWGRSSTTAAGASSPLGFRGCCPCPTPPSAPPATCSTRAAEVHWTIGPLLVSFATIAAWQATRSVRWVNLVLAVILLAAPLVTPYGTAALLMAIASAAAVAATTPFGGAGDQRVGGG